MDSSAQDAALPEGGNREKRSLAKNRRKSFSDAKLEKKKPKLHFLDHLALA